MNVNLPSVRYAYYKLKRCQSLLVLVLVIIVMTAYFLIPAPPSDTKSTSVKQEQDPVVIDQEKLQLGYIGQIDSINEPKPDECDQFYAGEWRGPAMPDDVCFYPHHPCRDLSKHPIQVWSGAWGHSDGPDECPVPFVFTNQPNSADVIISVVPGTLSNSKVGRCQRTSIFAVESAANYPTINDAKKTHDISSTYEIFHADNPVPYTYNFIKFTKPPQPTSEKNKEKVGALVASFVSNCGAQNDRNIKMKELGDLIPVHQFGSCMNNARPIQNTHRWDDKMVELRRHKFTISYENSHAVDYVTEKLFQPLEAGSVPLVYGAPNARDFVPKGRFPSAIFIEDFKTTKDLASYLNYLDSNDTAYEEYLEWKNHPMPKEFSLLQEPYKYNCVCRLAMLLAGKWRNPNLVTAGWTPDTPDKHTGKKGNLYGSSDGPDGNPRNNAASWRNNKGSKKVSPVIDGHV